MLHKFLSSVRHMGKISDFDSYYLALSRHNLPGGPTADEAKKDYRNQVKHELPWG